MTSLEQALGLEEAAAQLRVSPSTLRKRAADTPNYWCRFQLAGREVRLSTGTANREQAKEFEAHARAAAWRQVRLGERPAYAWSDARKRWLSETRKRSIEKDETILTWFDEHLAGQSIQAITREVVEELRALKAAEQSESTADRYMALLRAILKKAQADWQVIDVIPKVAMYRPTTPDFKWLRRAEFEKLCAEFPMHLLLAARFAAETGLRMRSMLALTWDRVEMDEGRAWVLGHQMKAKKAIGVPLSSEAVRILRALRALAGPKATHVFVWKGEPIRDCNTAAFQKAVTRAGVGPLRWHDLRHTWASWHVQAGTTLQELKELGGWATFAMVLKYAHLAPDHLAEAAENLARKPAQRSTGVPRGT